MEMVTRRHGICCSFSLDSHSGGRGWIDQKGTEDGVSIEIEITDSQRDLAAVNMVGWVDGGNRHTPLLNNLI